MSVSLTQDALATQDRITYEEIFPSVAEEKLRVIEKLLSLVDERSSLSEEGTFKARLCFDELIENALKHGNKYDPSKKVRVAYFEDEAGWGIIVGDEGVGFDLESVRDPLSDEGLLRESGRGIYILSQFMDSVEYFDGGRIARIYKRLKE